MSRDAPAGRFVDVFELALAQARIGGRLPFAAMPRLLALLAQPLGTLEYTMHGFIDDRGRPSARLEFSGVAQLVCDRCGMAMPFELNGASSYYFVRTERELGRIPVDDSIEEPLLGSSRFDLHELLEDEAILALPISPRHAECSTAPTTEPVPLPTEDDRPHPFAQLAQLKSRRQ